MSLLWVDRLYLDKGTRIGHMNVLLVKRLLMRQGAYVGRLNVLRGPLSVALARDAAIGNANKIGRAAQGSVTHGPASLRLGELSKLTSNHIVDCTYSVQLGDYSTVAGNGSQFWTHGYVHDETGPGRYRIDGGISLGHNVYIGSACIVTTGVQIADGVMVGAGTTIARSLLEPGMYVSAGVRRLDRPAAPDSRKDLEHVDDPRLCERVYVKRPPSR